MSSDSLAAAFAVAVARRHHRRQAVLRAVAVGEARHHRDVQDVAAELGLAVLDQVGVGAPRGQQRDLRRHQRHLDHGDGRARAGQAFAHVLGGLDAALVDVGVGILEIAHEHREIVDHLVRDVGVQVECRDDRDVRTDGAADRLQQIAVGIVRALGQSRAMGRYEDGVERQRGLQAGLDLGDETPEEAFLDRAAGLGLRDAQRHRRPLSRAIHLGEEAGQVGQGDRGGRTRLAHDLVAADIDVGLEVRRGGDRCEPVALDGEAEHGNPRIVLRHGSPPSGGERGSN